MRPSICVMWVACLLITLCHGYGYTDLECVDVIGIKSSSYLNSESTAVCDSDAGYHLFSCGIKPSANEGLQIVNGDTCNAYNSADNVDGVYAYARCCRMQENPLYSDARIHCAQCNGESEVNDPLQDTKTSQNCCSMTSIANENNIMYSYEIDCIETTEDESESVLQCTDDRAMVSCTVNSDPPNNAYWIEENVCYGESDRIALCCRIRIAPKYLCTLNEDPHWNGRKWSYVGAYNNEPKYEYEMIIQANQALFELYNSEEDLEGSLKWEIGEVQVNYPGKSSFVEYNENNIIQTIITAGSLVTPKNLIFSPLLCDCHNVENVEQTDLEVLEDPKSSIASKLFIDTHKQPGKHDENGDINNKKDLGDHPKSHIKTFIRVVMILFSVLLMGSFVFCGQQMYSGRGQGNKYSKICATDGESTDSSAGGGHDVDTKHLILPSIHILSDLEHDA